jgi:hypothetical protein
LASTSSAAERAAPTSVPLVRAIPVWAWLTAIVVVSALVRYAFGRRIVAPWIMVDELIYSELAKSFAAQGHFLVRERPAAGYGFVYPLLISPAYGLFGSVPAAYAAAKAINAVVMSSAALPAYFLARRVLDRGLALAAAALALAVPSLVYTGTLMTENAFYPLFLCVALALVLVLERPAARRQLVLLALCAVAYLTRQQALALLVSAVAAPPLLALVERAGLRSLRAYRVLWLALGGGLAAAVAVEAARGRSPLALLGAYRVTGSYHYSLGTVAKWLLYHVAELDLYLGVVPFAALALLALCARGLPRPARIFVVAAVALTVPLVVEVAFFASLPSVSRIEERNLFYVAPLFLIALLVWIERGLPRPRRLALGVALAAGLLPAALPYAKLIGLNATADTLALMPWWRLQDRVLALGHVRVAATACALAAAAAWYATPLRRAWLLPAFVAAYFLLVQWPAQDGVHGFRYASLNALFGGITVPHRDWIDRAVGRHADVAALWTAKPDRHVIWENEFFNRSVGRVYWTSAPLGGGLPQTRLRDDPRTGLLLDPHGRAVRARYVLVDSSIVPEGRVVARDERKAVAVWKLDGPLRSTTRVTGVYGDTWSGPFVTYTRRHCAGGRLRVLLQSDSHLLRRPQRIRANGVVERIPPGESAALVLPLRATGGRCTVHFAVSPTAVPGHGDPRRLGVHFTSFEYVR